MIKKYRCDKPMAEKKGILQVCDHDCKNCLCAMAMSESGAEYHVGITNSGTSANVTRRNHAMGFYIRPNEVTGKGKDRQTIDWRFDRRRSD